MDGHLALGALHTYYPVPRNRRPGHHTRAA